jgi:hypothetical protein
MAGTSKSSNRGSAAAPFGAVAAAAVARCVGFFVNRLGQWNRGWHGFPFFVLHGLRLLVDRRRGVRQRLDPRTAPFKARQAIAHEAGEWPIM